MARILIKAMDAAHVDGAVDQRACFKRGMPVVVMPDDHRWGAKECPPMFGEIWIPHVGVGKVAKYVRPQTVDFAGRVVVDRRRIWIVRWEALPLIARSRLKSVGTLIIKARESYTGPYHYTWQQVKNYFRNQQTGLNETEDI